MKELDIEAIVQYAKEQYPQVRPRIISDNGPQFIANDFKSFVRLHSAIGYITPSDMLAGKQKAIHEERDRKLEDAREDQAKIRAQQAAARYAKSLHDN